MASVDKPFDENRPLAQISTVWSVVIRARDGAGVSEAELASFFAAYHGAVYRYFLTATGRSDVAEDLTQDFALRFIKGDFRRVHPESGRFRDFLSVALANQLRDFYRRQSLRKGTPLPEETLDPKCEMDTAEFEVHWRDELLAQTWLALEHHQQTTGEPYHTALRLKASESNLTSALLAEKYSEQTGVPMSDAAFRKLLQRARDRFGEILIQIVAGTLAVQTREELERELVERQLHSYCKSRLTRTSL